MRFARVTRGGEAGLAIHHKGHIRALLGAEGSDLDTLLRSGEEALERAFHRIADAGEPVTETELRFLPPLARPSKIICLGLNYVDHAAESGFEPPEYPTMFARFASSLIGHGEPILLPRLSSKLDYEAELVAVIGRGGKAIARDRALTHVAGYSAFNDGSLRDYQNRTPQWTAGKNFDSTGAFGPWLVTSDELPDGAAGLTIETRLNGQVVQHSSTSQMIFDVAHTIHLVSSFLTLEPGDMLVMGTPAGVGAARKPPLWMKHGDLVEVEIERIGILRNPVVAE